MSIPRDPFGPNLESDACFCGHSVYAHLYKLGASERSYCGEGGCRCEGYQSIRVSVNAVANTLADLVEALDSLSKKVAI